MQWGGGTLAENKDVLRLHPKAAERINNLERNGYDRLTRSGSVVCTRRQLAYLETYSPKSSLLCGRRHYSMHPLSNLLQFLSKYSRSAVCRAVNATFRVKSNEEN